MTLLGSCRIRASSAINTLKTKKCLRSSVCRVAVLATLTLQRRSSGFETPELVLDTPTRGLNLHFINLPCTLLASVSNINVCLLGLALLANVFYVSYVSKVS